MLVDSVPRSPPILSYAPRPRFLLSRLFRWITLGLVIVLAATVWHHRKVVQHRSELLYWQHRLATFTPDSNSHAYVADLEFGPSLLKDPNYQPVYPPHTSVVAAKPPEALRFLSYAQICLMSGARSTPFIHQMRKPNGERRLVMVVFDVVPGCGMDTTAMYRAEAFVIKPIGVFEATAPNVLSSRGYVAFFCPKENRSVRIWHGRIDPADATRFRIDITVAGEMGTIEGRLLDTDAVELTIPNNVVDWTNGNGPISRRATSPPPRLI